jgi:hypothetical protein
MAIGRYDVGVWNVRLRFYTQRVRHVVLSMLPLRVLMPDRMPRLAHLIVGIYPIRHHTTAQTRTTTARRQVGFRSHRDEQALLAPRQNSAHSKQQEPRRASYISGSQHCSPSGDESLRTISSKLHVRHFQATDRVCMRLAYLAYVCGRLKCVLTKNEELFCKVQTPQNILMSFVQWSCVMTNCRCGPR